MDTIVAGAGAALTIDLLIYPLDTLKTRLQVPDVDQRFPTRKALFTGLYRGIGTVVIATLPAAGVFFTTYESCKGGLSSHFSGPALHLSASAIAELASCAVLTPAEIIKQRAQTASLQATKKSGHAFQSAADQIKEQAAKASKGQKSVGAAVSQGAKGAASSVMNQTTAGQTTQQIAKDLGVEASSSSSKSTKQANLSKTFVRGYLALAGRNLPFTAMQFPLYEHFRVVFSKRYNVKLGSDTNSSDVLMTEDTDSSSKSKSTSSSSASNPAPSSSREDIIKPGLVAASSAALAGSIAALLSTPIDNAKTRIMITDADTPALPGKARTDGGTIRTMIEIWQKEGAIKLMKGGALRSAWTALGAGLYLGSYESGRLWWRSRPGYQS